MEVFNDAIYTFYLRLYGVELEFTDTDYVVKSPFIEILIFLSLLQRHSTIGYF